jgi:hydroxylaminobenzene mutase
VLSIATTAMRCGTFSRWRIVLPRTKPFRKVLVEMTVLRGARQILIHGMAMVLVGLVWGFAIPMAPHPRLALGAHIQFVLNGMLLMVLATALLSLPHRVGLKSTWIMTLAAWLTWGMAMSEVANSWWGTTQTLPIAASQSAADGGKPWQELVVTIAHFAAGLGLIIAWVLLLIGFVKQPTDESSVH